MNIKENVSKNLRKFRKERKIKQKELGELIGYKKQLYQCGNRKNSITLKLYTNIKNIKSFNQ